MDIETNQFLTKLKKQPTIEERLLAIEKDISLIKKKLSIQYIMKHTSKKQTRKYKQNDII